MTWLKVHKVAGIRNLLKRNYKIEWDTVDVVAEVDDALSFRENWTLIKARYVRYKCND